MSKHIIEKMGHTSKRTTENDQIHERPVAKQINVAGRLLKVLQTREEIRQYWEERNREHFTRTATKPHQPAQDALWTKLEEQKAKRTSKTP